MIRYFDSDTFFHVLTLKRGHEEQVFRINSVPMWPSGSALSFLQSHLQPEFCRVAQIGSKFPGFTFSNQIIETTFNEFSLEHLVSNLNEVLRVQCVIEIKISMHLPLFIGRKSKRRAFILKAVFPVGPCSRA